MGGTVSREHAKLPFGYTHARKEDHSCSASASSLATRRQRLASRLLLLKSQDSTTSVTPLQSPHHRLPLPEDGSHPGTFVNGEGGLPVGPAGGGAMATGTGLNHLSLASFSSQDNNDNDDYDDDEDGENAETVSLSSILNQGPEIKLQWHAVSQDLDLDPNVDTYPYPYTYPIPYPGASVFATGSETAAAIATKALSSTQRIVESTRVIDDDNMNLNQRNTDTNCPVHSPCSLSSSSSSPASHRSAADSETTAGVACHNPGPGSSSAAALLLLTSAESDYTHAAAAENEQKDNSLSRPSMIVSSRGSSSIASGSGSNQPHASLLSQSRTTVTVSTAAATVTNNICNHNHNDHPHTLSLSALPHSDNTLCDKISDQTLDKIIAGPTDNSNSNNSTQQDDNNKSVQLSPQRTQSLGLLQQSSSQQDLIGSASTVFEHDLDDSDDELRGPSDRKMDLIAALGITDLPDRTPSPGPQDIPFSFFTEEPTFHAFQDPTSSQLFNMRRYTTDGYSKGKEVCGPWMDQTDETVVHLPQDFFDRYGPSQQDLDGDGLGDDFDGELEHEEQPRFPSRRLGKRLSLGNIGGYSSSGAFSGGHATPTNSTMMLNMLIPSAPDEDVAHLSPIPFSELPSLTNIGLCSQRIVKLSSNIRLLSSTTCLQICCNDLCVIPPEIGYLRNLTLLDLSKNSLMNIPDSIRFLTKLVDLRLSGNFIDSLPPCIGELTKLTHLSVENNQLKRLPRQLGQLKALTHLVLDDNPITVLPAEVGQLQYLRRLKLDRCPLVREFVHSPVHSPPTLMELAARVILRQGMVVPPLLPSHLKAYLRTSQRCSFCDGPYFESFVKRGKMIDKNEFLVPLEYTLCMPHWNTETERVKLLFGPRPITSPKPRTPRRTAAATGLMTTTPEAGTSAATATPGASMTTAATPATTATRRHMKSESAGPVLTSTATSILNSGSSSANTNPVGQTSALFTSSPVSLNPTSPVLLPVAETTSPSSSNSSSSGNGGGSGRKSRGFRSKLGSSSSGGIWSSSAAAGSGSGGGGSSNNQPYGRPTTLGVLILLYSQHDHVNYHRFRVGRRVRPDIISCWDGFPRAIVECGER
ncbi:hypothetical protein EC991_008962 [Linnemannia zychae]|nr:hypothetical protein EC991_008962 [Linnemannia zychae]